jgi:succinylarginine dihydrolase
VDDRFAGHGVAQRLDRETLDRGIATGYRTAVVEATNRTSEHIFSKLGFAASARTSYASYRHDGMPVFAAVADHGGPWSSGASTVECDSPSRWAAAFSDPVTRTAATTPTSRSVARSAGRDDRRVMRCVR